MTILQVPLGLARDPFSSKNIEPVFHNIFVFWIRPSRTELMIEFFVLFFLQTNFCCSQKKKNIYIYTYTHVHTHAITHTFAHTDIHIYTHTDHTCTYAQIYIYTCVYIHIQRYMHVCVHRCIYIYMCMCTELCI